MPILKQGELPQKSIEQLGEEVAIQHAQNQQAIAHAERRADELDLSADRIELGVAKAVFELRQKGFTV